MASICDRRGTFIPSILFSLGVDLPPLGAIVSSLYVLLLVSSVVPSRAEQLFEVQPGDTSVLMGESFTLYCRVANKTGVTYWEKDNVTFAVPGDGQFPASDRWAVFGDLNSGEYNLQVLEAQKMDEGTYTCMSTSAQRGENDISSDPAIVKVTDTPAPGSEPICLTSKIGNLSEGDPVDFTCAYAIDQSSNNDTILSWERTGPREDPQTALPLSDIVDREEYLVRKMTVTITTNDHLATYTCTARYGDGEGEATCSTGSLLVQHAPIVEVEPGSIQTEVGADVNFSCILLSAYPKDIYYSWYYMGRMLEPGEEEKFSFSNSSDGMVITVLGLTDTDDGGQIICVISNSVGSGSASGVIKLPERPFDLERDILIWLIPLGAIALLLFLAFFLAIYVLDCRLLAQCCDKRKHNLQGPQTHTWSTANLAMTLRARSLVDLNDEYFIARSIGPSNNVGIRPDNNLEDRKIPLSEEHVNPNFILEKEGHGRYGTSEREKQLKTRSERDRLRQQRGVENDYDDATIEIARVQKQDSQNADSGLSSSRESQSEKPSPTLQRLNNNVRAKKELYAAVERKNLGLDLRKE